MAQAAFTDGSANDLSPDEEFQRIWFSILPSCIGAVGTCYAGWFSAHNTVAGFRASVNRGTVPLRPLPKYHPAKWTLTVEQRGCLEGLVGSFVSAIVQPIFQMIGLPAEEDWVPDAVSEQDPLDPIPRSGLREYIGLFLVNFIGGLAARPFILARTRVNTQLILEGATAYPYKGSFHAISKTYNEEGLHPFVRGAGLSAATYALAVVAQQWASAKRNVVYKQVTRVPFVANNSVVLSLVHALFSGIAAVVELDIGLVVLRPLDVICRRLDMQGTGMEAALGTGVYTGVIQCAKTIWREEGIAGFYKGLSYELWREVPITFVMTIIGDLALSRMGIYHRHKTYADW